MQKLFILLILFASVVSWASCEFGSSTQRVRYSSGSCSGFAINCNFDQFELSACDGGTACYVPSYSYSNYCVITNKVETNRWCNSPYIDYRIDYVRCSTQAEADSIKCVLNPDAEGCAVEVDTTLWACSESLVNGATSSALYRLQCRAKNGVVLSCNGKTNVDIPTDGELVRRMSGTCAQNGYEDGVQSDGGGSGADSTGATAECFAVVGAYCYMRDKRSGNTYNCACDGNCQVAMRAMITGQGCANPYPQQDEETSDSISFPMSSEEFIFSSSSAAGPDPSSANSFANEIDALNNLYGVLDTIRDTLSRRVAPAVENIQANTQLANDYLLQIANKDWNPTINVGSPDVIVQGDTNIINVSVEGGDTSKAGAAILAWLTDENYSFGVVSDTSQLHLANLERDSLTAYLDTLTANEIPHMGDSMGGALLGVSGALQTLRDTIEGGAFGDSLARWESLITNNGVITGSGSDNCPSVLTQPVIFNFPPVGQINAGTLGRYICAPIAGLNVTLWVLIRVLLRAGVAIGCMYWIFKAVTGTDGNEEE